MAESNPGMEVESSPTALRGDPSKDGKQGIVDQVRLMASNLSLWQKVSLGGIAATIVVGIILLVSWSGRAEYELLFGDLAPENASLIVEQLKEKEIPYKISAGGTRLEVEQGKARELRLSFIGQGLPTGGKGKGFELFDELKLGATNFVENLNYRRALEGELARTIVRFREVTQARIHLVIPKRSLYWEKQEEPTASVWLKLRGGAGLDRGQVKAVVHLVSGAVEGLSPGNITVVDSLGHILTEPEQPHASGLTQAQLTLRREAEKGFESKITSLLSPIVGQDKVRAKVSVTMDFKEVKQEEESYDPAEQVLRSEQDLAEESGIPNAVGGVPGTQSNLSEGQSASDGASKEGNNHFKRVQRTRNYELGRTVRTTVEHPGEITRVSAAVILDDKTIITEEDGERKYEYEALPANVVAKCTGIVEKAIGFSKDRGDTVVVENLSFDRQVAEEERLAAAESERGLFWSKVLGAIRTPLIIISLMLVFVLIIRPLMKGLVVRDERVLEPVAALAGISGEGAEALPEGQEAPDMALEGKTIEEIEAEILSGASPTERVSKRDVLIKRITQIIDSDTDSAIQMLRTWISGAK